jgi:alanyl-tRNA synthetase
MMRRTIRNIRLLGSGDPTTHELITTAIAAMSPQYPELHTDRARILEIAVGEESAFLQTLKSGTLIFDSAAGATKKSGAKSLSGSDAFKLHDTYGFPYDLTLEMASEQGLTVDEDAFRKLMKEQRDRAKADARAKKSGHADLSIYRSALDQSGITEFTGYTQIKSESKIKYLLVDGVPVASAKVGDEVEIMLDRTPFYAEGGGQLSDSGFIRTANGAVIEIDDVQTPLPNLFLHRGKVVSGEVLVNENGLAEIDNERRSGISRAHTATHMVHKAFREALGETATQAGSENAPGRFRFDFSAVGAVSQATMSEVEDRVNSLLVTDLEISAEVMSQDEAKAIGAMPYLAKNMDQRFVSFQ